ncbi:MAG: hypothetical protein KatS3mg002_1555 [Candidatus Woesearchaeota archaeon]|nr:MAG: hypothetical protein KatS3mg002_1555 [Candidatus Woesearchaeota archaeon]
MSYKICFIIPFYGKLPNYLKLFLKSSENNLDYDFIFFSDLRFPKYLPSNVKIYELTLKDFSNLIHIKTGIMPTINYGWKICDFKPAFGIIFNDYIKNYHFWGILDVDLILGKINGFITNHLLKQFDIISAKKFWLSGSIALFRNCHSVNTLFMKSKDWKKVFQSGKHFAFDECGRLKAKKGQLIYTELLKGKSIFDLNTDIEAFTHIIKNTTKVGNLKVFFDELICEKIYPNMILSYDEGELSIHNVGKSTYSREQKFLTYHLVNDKNKITFSIPKWETVPDKFYITNYGFIKEEQLNYLVIIKIIFFVKGSIKFLFINIPSKILRKLRKIRLKK